MLGHRQLGIDDYFEILRKRWWMILIPTIVCGFGAYAGSLLLQDQYTSRTLVLVEQQKVPDTYVKPVTTEDIGQRLGTMQEQILSRTRLQPIIEKFDLYKGYKGKLSMEEMVDKLKKSIVVTPIQSLVTTKAGEMPGFSISYSGPEPKLTQQICSEILSMFVEKSIDFSTQSAEVTTDFLKSTLDRAKKDLDNQDARLAEFQRKYLGTIPGNEQMDMQMMQAITSQLDAVTSQLNRAQQDKAYVDSLLAQQLAAWEVAQKAGVETPSFGGPTQKDPLQAQLTQLQNQLIDLKSHYTDDHPDVVKLKADIAALKEKIAENEGPQKDSGKATTAAAGKTVEPPAIAQLRYQSHQDEVTIKEKTREQSQLRSQLSVAQGRLSMSPTVEQQYKEITRDYQTALQFYNDTLAKKNQSEMATNLARQQQGEQFRVMDPPNLPEKPSFPNRPVFAGAGFGFGLAMGVGMILLLELLDKSLKTEGDIEQFLGLPTLALVPVITESESQQKQTGLLSLGAAGTSSKSASV